MKRVCEVRIGGRGTGRPAVTTSHLSLSRESAKALPAGYAAVLSDIKNRIRSARTGAALSVNRQLIRT